MTQRKLDRQTYIAKERKLAKFANLMDGIIRIPFTRKGFGLDAILSTVPVIGDTLGLLLTLYVFKQAKDIGVSNQQLKPALKLAFYDALVGLVPIAGTVFDVFMRPSHKTQEIVRAYLQDEHDIVDTTHIEHPFLQSSLEKKQRQSSLWRNPIMAWLWLHIPQIGLVLIIVLLGLLIWGGFAIFMALIDAITGG